jgi:hypothetical protein
LFIGSGRGGRSAAKLPNRATDRGNVFSKPFPRPFSPARIQTGSELRTADPGGQPLGPNRVRRIQAVLRIGLLGKGVWNQELAKALLGADSKKIEDAPVAAY